MSSISHRNTNDTITTVAQLHKEDTIIVGEKRGLLSYGKILYVNIA
ncbi:hypothetical protein [Parageobacillus thermoglucosidasius]|nr:hypothetical protein [Parageobacillus thermoglucosidasius]